MPSSNPALIEGHPRALQPPDSRRRGDEEVRLHNEYQDCGTKLAGRGRYGNPAGNERAERAERAIVMRVIRSAAAVVLITGGLLAPDPAGATGGIPGGEPVLADQLSSLVSPGWQEKQEEALARVQRTRELVSTMTLTQAVRAAADLIDVSLDPPSPSGGARLGGLPAPLDEAVGRLVSAVEVARRLARESVLRPGISEAEVMGLIVEVFTGKGAAQRRAGRAMSGIVDRGMLLSGALLLSNEIDAALPALASYGGPLPRSGAESGCDVLDLPNVCIGGEQDNTYDVDKALLIDLGGDDTYHNSAGGADLSFPVSVNIDVAGNDTYATTAKNRNFAQGAGFLGGIGILVDAAGDDSYTAESLDKDADPGISAQGYGGAGVGVLADFSGNDSYRTTNTTWIAAKTPAKSVANGQGIAGQGVGLLLDGGGNDSYLTENHPVPRQVGGEWNTGTPIALGSGVAGPGGAAILFDAGGADTAQVIAANEPVAQDETRPVVTDPANAEGFGWASLPSAVAMVLSGPGPTTRVLRGEVVSPRATSPNVYGFGWGALGGSASISDLGGDDVYVQEGIGTAVARRTIDDDCECDGLETYASVGAPFVWGQGWGLQGGTGLLHDAAGNDRYVARAIGVAESEARDERSGPSAGKPVELQGPDAIAVVAGGYLQAQGAGLTGGAGFLLDEGGNDSYEAEGLADTKANASAASPELTPKATASSSAIGLLLGVYVQGYGQTGGFGSLRDLGGNDRYVSSAISRAAADPPTDVRQGTVESAVQGANIFVGAGLLLDVDGTGQDEFVWLPAQPACVGTHGQGVWRDCQAGVGIGINV